MIRRAPMLFLVAAAACTPARLVTPLRAAPGAMLVDEPFRGIPPRVVPVVERLDLAPVLTTLPNGLRVVFVPRHDYPMVAAQLVSLRGSLDLGDAGSRKGEQAMTFFAHGSNAAAFGAIQEATARTGDTWSANGSSDAQREVATGPRKELDSVLDLVAHWAIASRLSQEEYDRQVSEWTRAQSARLVSVSLGERRVLFGHDHPYGVPARGERPISREEAQAFHDRLFQPSQAALIVVGDVSPEDVTAGALRAFAAWRDQAPVTRVSVAAPSPNGPRLGFIVRNGLAQRYVSVFARGPSASSEDLTAFVLLGQVAGGVATSKLFEDLRDSGDSYTPAAAVSVCRGATWVSFNGAYANSRAVSGTRKVLASLAAIREGNVTDEQLGTAREVVLAAWRARMTTVLSASSAYADDAVLGVDLQRDYPARVAKVTREDLIRVAKTYLAPEGLHVLILGDEHGLDLASLDLGSATIIDLAK